MRAIVCLKQVWDSRFITYDIAAEQLRGLQLTLNRYDEIALAAAVSAKEKGILSEIVAVGVGDAEVEKAMRRACIIGVDRAIHLLVKEVDWRGKVKAAAELIGKLTPDIILCGARGEDEGRGLFGAALAEYLKAGYVTRVVRFAVQDGRIQGLRKLDRGWREHFRAELPTVITIEEGAGDIPYIPLMSRRYNVGMRQSIETMSHDLGERETSGQQDKEILWSSPRPRTKVTQTFSADDLWGQILGPGVSEEKNIEEEKVVSLSEEAIRRCLKEMGSQKGAA